MVLEVPVVSIATMLHMSTDSRDFAGRSKVAHKETLHQSYSAKHGSETRSRRLPFRIVTQSEDRKPESTTNVV